MSTWCCTLCCINVLSYIIMLFSVHWMRELYMGKNEIRYHSQCYPIVVRWMIYYYFLLIFKLLNLYTYLSQMMQHEPAWNSVWFVKEIWPPVWIQLMPILISMWMSWLHLDLWYPAWSNAYCIDLVIWLLVIMVRLLFHIWYLWIILLFCVSSSPLLPFVLSQMYRSRSNGYNQQLNKVKTKLKFTYFDQSVSTHTLFVLTLTSIYAALNWFRFQFRFRAYGYTI